MHRNQHPSSSRLTSSRRLRRRLPLSTALLLALPLALLSAGSLLAFVVVLKDGTQIITAKPYEIRGDQVILTMPNGNTASYRAAEVDIEKTRQMNEGVNLTDAKVLKTQPIEVKPKKEEPQEASLSDLVSGRGLSLPEPRKRDGSAAGKGPSLPMTESGNVDLMRLERLPYADAEVGTELLNYLLGQGNEGARVYKGSDGKQPLVELRAVSDQAVFKCMRDAANALVQLNQRFPDRVSAFDLLVLTDKDIRGAQFSMTPEMAQLLVSGRMEPPAFFLRYVEF